MCVCFITDHESVGLLTLLCVCASVCLWWSWTYKFVNEGPMRYQDNWKIVIIKQVFIDCFTLLLARHLADVSYYIVISEAIRDVEQTKVFTHTKKVSGQCGLGSGVWEFYSSFVAVRYIYIKWSNRLYDISQKEHDFDWCKIDRYCGMGLVS